MNQLGDKPEEVRKRLEEERRNTREQDRSRDSADRVPESEELSGKAHEPTYGDERDSG
ncbi:hypothetical protein [Streptomyces sp. Wb2n-11]|uniref:hypothetical protein n=1 Tax=Streptomyces sp. Wb2n-11 TaxID=1030533 RepID=UPI000A5AACEC|nr:hypothetical protein [Streptomyces sp. Wb2n-11]